MKFKDLLKTATSGAAALLIAGCGGGGTTVEAPPVATPDPSLLISGTAATGLALAGAGVQVKCATGEGTATTSATGTYSVTLTGGALPCVIRVSGTAEGAEVVLHSVTEAGSADATSNQTSAVANVTPLTEIVVAQLTGALPSEVFTTFSADTATGITSEKLATATTAVLTTLKESTGLDFSTIDPFKAPLVAATTAAPTQGNPYDQLLDQLGTKVAPEALPQVVTQVATASASGDSAGLQEAMVAVEAGSLPGCPSVLSGKYRVLEYFGASYVRDVNFKTMKVSRPDGSSSLPITVDPAKPCEFVVEGNTGTADVKLEFVMGRGGVGAFRVQNFTSNGRNIGYVFPVQSHSLADLAGSWTFHQGGYMPGDGILHMAGKLEVAADGKAVPCDYDMAASSWTTCTPDTGAGLVLAARADGGFNLMEGSAVAGSAWGYRAPNGSLVVFGTTNEAGSRAAEVEQTTLVMAKLSAQELPAVGTVTKYWDVALVRSPTAGAGQNITPEIAADASTVKTVDATARSAVRTRASDGREDTVHYDKPATGLRHRPAGTWNGAAFSGVYQFPMMGAGVSISINTSPTANHLYNVSIVRP